MAIIQQIEKKSRVKNIFILHLDSGEVFEVYDEIMVLYKLKEGKVVDDDTLKNIISESAIKIGISYALNLLSRGMKTKFELIEKLKLKKINESVIQEIVSKMEKYGYLNDEDYAKAYFELNKGNKGINKIKHELALKGIAIEYLDELETDFEDEFQTAKKIAEKYLKNKEINFKTKTKLFTFLASKGFNYDTINLVASEYFN